MIRGECADCGKTYKVPSADRTYTCKACSGEVRVPQPEDSQAAVPCVECGEWNDPEDAFCVECGVSLKPKSEQKDEAPSKRTHTQRKERVFASQELAQAKKGIFIARVIFSFFAVGMLVMGLAFMASSGSGLDPDAENAETILRVAGVLSFLLGFVFVGIIVFLPRAPMVLGVMGASMYTVFQLLDLLASELAVGTTLKSLAYLVIIWAAVIPLAGVRRIQREHPDLYSARAGGGKAGRLRAEGISASRAKVERHRSKRRAKDLKLRLAVVGSIVLVLGGGGFFYWLSKQPSELQPRLESFQAAWKSSDPGMIQPYFATKRLSEIERWVRYYERKDGWEDSWPPLVAIRIGERRGKQALADFMFAEDAASPGAHLQTRWRWREDAWYLDKFKLVREYG